MAKWRKVSESRLKRAELAECVMENHHEFLAALPIGTKHWGVLKELHPWQRSGVDFFGPEVCRFLSGTYPLLPVIPGSSLRQGGARVCGGNCQDDQGYGDDAQASPTHAAETLTDDDYSQDRCHRWFT